MKLLDRLDMRLTDEMRRALDATVSAAERRGEGLSLVGGAVRDLLLDTSHVDIDLVVEGDAIKLASAVGRKLRARVVTYPRFGTASVRNDGVSLDFATARTESYLRPGALPTVRPAGLDADLARRDFTINAMALRLAGSQRGRLIDPHGGRRDAASKTLRVLHDESFQDDATRIYRAVRYAGRLKFRVHRRTDALLRRDLLFLDTISGTRLRRELERIAVEPNTAEILRRADGRGVLEATHPALQAGPQQRSAAGGLTRLPESHRDAALLCILISAASPAGVEQAMGRLSFTGRQASAVGGFVALRAHERQLADAADRPSDAVRLLSPRPPESIESFALVAEGRAAAAARLYTASWRHVRPRLTGNDVVACGVPRGPQVGAAMDALRSARLDGETKSRDDEIAMLNGLREELATAEQRGG